MGWSGQAERCFGDYDLPYFGGFGFSQWSGRPQRNDRRAEKFDFPTLSKALENGLLKSTEAKIFGLLLLGLGIFLVASFPFHTWKPPGATRPLPPSSMLHAGVLKVRALRTCANSGTAFARRGTPEWSPWLMWLALQVAFFSSGW